MYQREYERNPTRGLMGAMAKLWDRQKMLARFFNGKPQDFFLRSNVTEAMNAFILGARLPARSEILMTDLEYGAIQNICRFRAERDDLKLRSFALPTENASEIVEAIAVAIKPETSLLVISHVLTGNGTVLPLKEIARETRRRGVLLAVDGAHAAGAVPLSFDELAEVEFYGGNLHKWMMGPKGTAFGWINPAARDRIAPIDAGWTSFEILPNFAGFGNGDLFTHQFLMKGCFNFAPFLALKELFEFRNELGEAAITRRCHDLRTYCDTVVQEILGWKRLTPREQSLAGPLLAYELPAALQTTEPELMKLLDQKHGLQVQITFFRGKRSLRLSPHIYNSEQEIEKGVSLLASIDH